MVTTPTSGGSRRGCLGFGPRYCGTPGQQEHEQQAGVRQKAAGSGREPRRERGPEAACLPPERARTGGLFHA